jgi:predicted RecB family nuclease
MARSLHSPTMLKNYLSCEYIVYNEKNEKDLGLTRKERSASDAARLNKGNEHEKIVFNEFKKKFKNIADIKNKKISREDKISETLKAIKEGADLIYGGFLNYDEWIGEFDFLIKDPNIKTEFGNYGYEIVDAKNTTKPKADHIVQLGMYSLMLEHHQKQMPQYVSIALKDNIIERIKTSEIYEFFNYNKDKYEEFLKKKLIKLNQLNVLFAVFVTGKKNVKKFGLKKII